MITFTQLYTRVADAVGVDLSTSAQDETNFKQDINQGLRLFKNAARRYWTRKEVTTNLVSGQQYYTFPEDMVRITTVRANTGTGNSPSGGYNWPLTEVDSEELWNKFNVIPSNTVIVPQFYFVRGRNEVGLYPIPSNNVTAGLVVSYEPRMIDMSVDDTTNITVTVTHNSQYVTVPSSPFNSKMAGMYFSVTNGNDGNWYPITGANGTQLTLENYYQGPSGTLQTCIIGLVPDIPEEYHIALVYYAAWQYFLKRNENANATLYNGMFQNMMNQYIETYAAKSTGVVQKPLTDNIYNIFWLPPGVITS
jgi:hypothetical protein